MQARTLRFASGSTVLRFARRGTALGTRVVAKALATAGLDRGRPAAAFAVLCDRTLPAARIRAALRGLGASERRVRCLRLPSGDEHKSLATAGGVYAWLDRIRADRQTVIVAVGGGTIGDLAGFVAATWMRGVPWVNVPTTLLAMVDSCVGGKVAVNLDSRKNVVGAYWHPVLVWIDHSWLDSLPQREFIGGLAESVKHALGLSPAFLKWQETHARAIAARNRGAIASLIERNLRLKAAVVAADERESPGARAVGHAETTVRKCGWASVGRAALNLGHTFGHALEAASQYRWSHGVCISLGLAAEMDLSFRAGMLSESQRSRVEALMLQLGLPLRAAEPFDPRAVLEQLPRDKKSRAGRVRFVLPMRPGALAWFELERLGDVRRSLRRIQAWDE